MDIEFFPRILSIRKPDYFKYSISVFLETSNFIIYISDVQVL